MPEIDNRLEHQKRFPFVRFYSEDTLNIEPEFLEIVDELNKNLKPLYDKYPFIYEGSLYLQDLHNWLSKDNFFNQKLLFDIYKKHFGNVIDTDYVRLFENLLGYNFQDLNTGKDIIINPKRTIKLCNLLTGIFSQYFLMDSDIKNLVFINGVPGVGKTYLEKRFYKDKILIISDPLLNKNFIDNFLLNNYEKTENPKEIVSYFIGKSPETIADNITKRMDNEQRIVPFEVFIKSFQYSLQNFNDTFVDIKPPFNELHKLFDNKPQVYLRYSNTNTSSDCNMNIDKIKETYNFNSPKKLIKFINYIKDVSIKNIKNTEILSKWFTQIGDFVAHIGLEL